MSGPFKMIDLAKLGIEEENIDLDALQKEFNVPFTLMRESPRSSRSTTYLLIETSTQKGNEIIATLTSRWRNSSYD